MLHMLLPAGQHKKGKIMSDYGMAYSARRYISVQDAPASIGGGLPVISVAGVNPPRKYTLREDKVRSKVEKVAWAMRTRTQRCFCLWQPCAALKTRERVLNQREFDPESELAKMLRSGVLREILEVF